MYLWIRINDSTGLITFSKGHAVSDTGIIMRLDEVDLILGTNSCEKIREINDASYLKDETAIFMKMRGWVEKVEFFKSNGDVQSYCF